MHTTTSNAKSMKTASGGGIAFFADQSNVSHVFSSLGMAHHHGGDKLSMQHTVRLHLALESVLFQCGSSRRPEIDDHPKHD